MPHRFCFARLFYVRLLFLLLPVFAWAQDYRPPLTVPLQDKETLSQLTKRLLPANAKPLIPAQRLDFGADKNGIFLAMAIAGESRGYAYWYLAPRERKDEYVVIRVKDPDIADSFYDLQIRDVFTIGPEGAKDLVILETNSRSAAAGGEAHKTGTVYRRLAGGVEQVTIASTTLDNIDDRDAAHAALETYMADIPEQKPGSLADLFLAVPTAYIDATKLERWQLIGPDSDRILVRDLHNGYVKIAGDAGFPGYTMALFRKADGSGVLALQTEYLIGQHTVFLERDGQKWRDVSATLVPDFDSDKHYRLPQLGTNLELLDDEGKVTMTLRWNRQTFEPVLEE